MCICLRVLIYSIYTPPGEVGAAGNFLQVNSRAYSTLVHSWNAWDGYRSVTYSAKSRGCVSAPRRIINISQ